MQARQGNVVPAYGVIHIVYLRRERFSVVSVGRREVCTDIIENRSLRAYLATTSVGRSPVRWNGRSSIWSSTRVAKLTPNASIGWRTVVSCGHAGVGVDVGKYDGPMI